MAHSKQHRENISKGLKRYHAGKGKNKRTVKTRIHKPSQDKRFKSIGKVIGRQLSALTAGRKPRKPKRLNLKRDLNKLMRSTRRASKKRA